MTAVDPNELADALAAAEASRTAIPQLITRYPDLDVETAYRVQEIGHQRRLDAGERFVGYKLGLVSRVKQVAMGVANPLWGRLTSGLLHPEDEPVSLQRLIHPRVEPEIGFLLGRDLDGETASIATVLAATEGVLPALEILDSRYEDFRFTLPDVVADNASAAGVILGGRMLAPSELDLQTEGVVLRCDGEVVETAAGAAVLGHPAAAVAWLASICGGLPAGALIISGGLTVPAALTGRRLVTAQYTHLGTVSVRIA